MFTAHINSFHGNFITNVLFYIGLGIIGLKTFLKRRKIISREKNLKDAFAGESQANRKYLAFAKKAKEKGYASIAKLFITAAGAEIIHSMQHLQTLGGGSKRHCG